MTTSSSPVKADAVAVVAAVDVVAVVAAMRLASRPVAADVVVSLLLMTTTSPPYELEAPAEAAPGG